MLIAQPDTDDTFAVFTGAGGFNLGIVILVLDSTTWLENSPNVAVICTKTILTSSYLKLHFLLFILNNT